MKEKFQQDLEAGNEGEREIAAYLKKKGLEPIEFRKDWRWDIKCQGKRGTTTFEVKTDTYEKWRGYTGNMFIEKTCSGKASGISTTEADIFVYYFPHLNEAWFIKTEKLRKNLPQFHITYSNGDEGRVSGYLVDREWFRYLFHVVKIT